MEGQDLDKVNAVINFAREAVRAEVMTPTGILNAIWILVFSSSSQLSGSLISTR